MKEAEDDDTSRDASSGYEDYTGDSQGRGQPTALPFGVAQRRNRCLCQVLPEGRCPCFRGDRRLGDCLCYFALQRLINGRYQISRGSIAVFNLLCHALAHDLIHR